MMSVSVIRIITQSGMILGNTVISIKFIFNFWHVPVYIPYLPSDDPCA